VTQVSGSVLKRCTCNTLRSDDRMHVNVLHLLLSNVTFCRLTMNIGSNWNTCLCSHLFSL
jgi:hypothetical protein